MIIDHDHGSRLLELRTSAGTWMLPAALASRRKRIESFSWARYSLT